MAVAVLFAATAVSAQELRQWQELPEPARQAPQEELRSSEQEPQRWEAPNPYAYTYRNGRTLKINWKPETAKTVQRYTIAINPAPLMNNGLRFDFELELPRPGNWLQIGLTGYFAPERQYRRSYYDWYGDSGNNRWGAISGFDDYNRMWGVGVQALYKWMFHRRGWYLNAGLAVEFFRVGRVEDAFLEYREDGLTFWEYGNGLVEHSYVRPSLVFNVGKHIAVSHRCFFDVYGGMSISYSIYDRNEYNFDDFSEMYGFARRGINLLNGGVRFGVLLWNN